MVLAAGTDERRAVFGARDYASGQLTWQLQEGKGGDALAAFRAQVAQTWPDEPVVLVLDQVSSHRSRAMRAWWAAPAGRIIPFWLPASPPPRNLIEQVWRFLTQQLACHRCWVDVAGLEAAAATLLDQIQARFHTDQPPAIRLVNTFCDAA